MPDSPSNDSCSAASWRRSARRYSSIEAKRRMLQGLFRDKRVHVASDISQGEKWTVNFYDLAEHEVVELIDKVKSCTK